jgi:hypothetical protein
MVTAAGSHDPLERRLALVAIGLTAVMPSTLVRGDRVLCPIRRATGRPCPTCGLTRSWHAALRGRGRESLGHHPLGPLALAAAAAYGLRIDERPGAVRDVLRQPVIHALTAALWVAVWIVRVRSAR